MTDRELLELAARAAGVELLWHNFSNVPTLYKGLSSDAVWNPLDDDGDALRLSVLLGCDLVTGRGKTIVWCQGVERCEYHGDDPYAATRRAIVRAAAEIGRGME